MPESILPNAYKIAHVREDFKARASRYCLRPVMLPARNKIAKAESAYGLVNRWYFRLKELQTPSDPNIDGWPHLQSGPNEHAKAKLWRAYRCPPVGVSIKEKYTYACGMPYLCPWCWCRQLVFPTCDGVRDALFAAPNSRKPSELQTKTPLELYLLRARLSLPCAKTSLEGIFEILAKAKLFFAGVFARSRFEHLRGGAVICSTISPPVQLSDDPRRRYSWTIEQRILWLHHFGMDVRLRKPFSQSFGLQGRGCKVDYLGPANLSRKNLVKAIGLFANYQRHMLTGDVGPTIELLKARSACSNRFVENYGIFRNSAEKPKPPKTFSTRVENSRPIAGGTVIQVTKKVEHATQLDALGFEDEDWLLAE